MHGSRVASGLKWSINRRDPVIASVRQLKRHSMRRQFLMFLTLALAGCNASDSPIVESARNQAGQTVPEDAPIVFFASSGESTKVGEYYAKYTKRLEPAIKHVEEYVAKHGKLPSQRTFQNWADESGAHMLIIWDRDHDYAAKHGATSGNDYLVGTWLSEWYFYYKSWDGNYIDASDDLDTGFVYDN